MQALLGTIHLLAVIAWIGGMFFAHFCLRPAAATLEPPLRLRLMHEALRRFLAVVAWAAAAVVASGVALLARGPWPRAVPLDTLVMAVLGLVMVAVFLFVRGVLFVRLSRALTAAQLAAAADALAAIRRLVALNLAIGVAIVVVVRFGAMA